MSLGGGYSQSSSKQGSESYGPLGGGGNRQLFAGDIMDLLTDRGVSGPQNQYGGGLFQNLFQRSQSQVPYQLPSLDASGLQAEQAQALQNPFQQAVNQALGRFSSIGASRGFLRPENVNAIAGAAAQNVAPQFAPLISQMATQNLQQRTQAPLVQEDLARQRFADLMNALGLGGTLLGVQATSFGQSKSMGVNASGSVLPTTPTQQTQGCWIAAVFYGEGSLEQQMIRAWLIEQSERSCIYRWFWNAYARYGELVARTLCKETWWKQLWRSLFAYFLRQAHAV